MPGECFDDPGKLYEAPLCLNAISKNIEGELSRPEGMTQGCDDPECKTLKTVQGLKVEVDRHDCDSPLGKRLNGVYYVERFVTAYEDADGNRRGIHAGDFRWEGPGVVVEGRMSGITNAGTHRKPVFDPCQPCDAHGYMEGRMCGSVTKTTVPDLDGCYYVGTYRILFDPTTDGGEGVIRGTFEGSLLCPCH